MGRLNWGDDGYGSSSTDPLNWIIALILIGWAAFYYYKSYIEWKEKPDNLDGSYISFFLIQLLPAFAVSIPLFLVLKSLGILTKNDYVFLFFCLYATIIFFLRT